jgi:cobalt-precorrin 5A hydrolase
LIKVNYFLKYLSYLLTGDEMKIALISLTNNGKKLAMQILSVLEEDHTVIRVDTFHKNVKQTLEDIIHDYDCIVGIMATGIMIRNVCKLIKSKNEDPAILIIDEKGKHVISLLSGHLGGGNNFSIKIASIIGAEPIITTATDINNKLGVDTLARKYYFNVNDVNKIKLINSALLNNKSIYIAYNPKYDYIWEDIKVRESYKNVKNHSKFLEVSYGSNTINLKPKKMVVGIGSRKDIDSDSVIKAIKSTFKILDLPVKRVDSIATGQMKENEKGIIYAAEELGIPLEIISEKAMKNFKNDDLSRSNFVMEKFGVPGVCEPSSLIAAGKGSTLIFRKSSYNGVTVAVAVSKN